jgi:hypothetical protein
MRLAVKIDFFAQAKAIPRSDIVSRKNEAAFSEDTLTLPTKNPFPIADGIKNIHY